MNAITLMTVMFGIGTVVTFVCGVTAMLRHGQVGHRSGAEWIMWHFLFEVFTFATILTAPLTVAR